MVRCDPGKIKPAAPFMLGTVAFNGWSLSGADLDEWSLDNDAVQRPGTAVNRIETVTVTLSPSLLTAPKRFVQVRAAP